MLENWKSRARRLKHETYALYLAYRDPRTPWYARLFAAAVVAYALSPIDLIPDPIPVLGYLDDLILVPLGIALALRMVPREVMAHARARAAAESIHALPVSPAAAALSVTAWIVLAIVAGVLVWRTLSGA